MRKGQVIDRVLAQVGLTRKKNLQKVQIKLEAKSKSLTEAQVQLKDALKELKENQSRQALLVKSLNFSFFAAHGDYIEAEVIPRAMRQKVGLNNDKFYTKKYGNRLRSFKNMTKYQRFFLELDCLSRLNYEMQNNNNYKHFPILFDFDAQRLEIFTSYNGISLQELNSEVMVNNLDGQIDFIVSALESAGIYHLDMSMTKNNILVDGDGCLSIIDFDMAQVDNRPFNWTVSENMKSKRYRLTRERLYEIVLSTKQIKT